MRSIGWFSVRPEHIIRRVLRQGTRMKRLLLIAVFVLSGACNAIGAQILASNLSTLEMPGKVSGVLWTRRVEFFTLQVLVPRRDRAGPGAPQIDAWLLMPDGSRIESAQRWQSRD